MMSAATIVDRTLEFAIAPSFTRVGPALRSRLDHWRSLDSYDLTGRVAVVTGATSGIGAATAAALLRCGATVEIVGRDATRTEAAATRLREQSNGRGSIDWVVADTGDLEAVATAAEQLQERHSSIDVVIHNAGALDATYRESAQGIEQTVASQVVGPFLLTGRLLPALRAAAPGRVLWVSSGGMYSQPLAAGSPALLPERYDGTAAYARAKRAQVTLNEMLAERLAVDDVRVHAMHPGWADTPGVEKSLPTFRKLVGPFLRSPQQGADTLVWLAADDTEPLASTGQFWLDRRPRSIHRLASTRRTDTPEARAALWSWVVAASGWDPDAR